MRHRVNEGCKVLGALKGVMKNRGLGMNVKKVLYEKVVVPTVMYGSESWGMKVTERQKLNVFEMKCLRSMTGVSRLDRVRNEVVRTRTGVRRELAARVDMNVLRWFGHMERMDGERLKTGENGLCCSNSAIQTQLGPSSLPEERSEIPICFVVSSVLSATPRNWRKRAKVYR